jgi:hypothetical protein
MWSTIPAFAWRNWVKPQNTSIRVGDSTLKHSPKCSLVDHYWCFRGTCCFHLQNRLLPWKWRQYIPSKQQQCTRLHGITSCKTAMFGHHHENLRSCIVAALTTLTHEHIQTTTHTIHCILTCYWCNEENHYVYNMKRPFPVCKPKTRKRVVSCCWCYIYMHL